MSVLKIRLRPYRLSDTQIIFNLHNDNGVVKNETISQFQQTLDVAEGVWVIVADDQVVGYTAVWQVAGLEDLLEMDGVILLALRRQGLGARLLNYVIVQCKALPFATLSYLVDDLDTAVAKFLQKQNFWIEHEEWTMVQNNLSALPAIPESSVHLQTYPRPQAIEQFVQIYDVSFVDTAWKQPFSTVEVAQLLTKASDLCFLVEQNTPIGVAWLHFAEAQQATIEPIGIIREAQGKGYGRILLTTLLHHLAQQKIQTVTLGVWVNNYKAISLYQSVGFAYIDTITYMACSLE